MQVGHGNCGWNLTTHDTCVPLNMSWFCGGIVPWILICMLGVAQLVVSVTACVVACSVTKEYTIRELWIQRMSKVTGLDGNLEVTKYFRHNSVAYRDADHLWGKWWDLPCKHWICLDLLQLLKTGHMWQNADTWNPWLVDCRGITVRTQMQGGSDSSVIWKVNFCRYKNFSSRTCLELNIRLGWKYSALWSEYCVMICVWVWKLLVPGVRITLIIWVFKFTVRIWKCQ
jgi:hypothetical protein